MTSPPLRGFAFAVAFATLSACSERAAEAQHREPAIGRGESAPAAGTANGDPGESACAKAGGQWQAEAQRCAVTEAMCANFGQWHEGAGCVMASVGPAECVGMSGLQVVGDSCVITHLAGDEMTQTGLSEEK